ncbi:hypothetical protein D3C80_1017810 [compost metagenome]
MQAAFGVAVFEQVLARQALERPHRPRQPLIADADPVVLAALAAKLEGQGGAVHLQMPLVQGGQAEAAVPPRVLGVADADQGDLQQAHRRRQDLVPAGAAQGQVMLHPLAQARQLAGEVGQAVELVAGGVTRPVGMIAVLLAASRIAARGLDMAVRARTDPDVLPGGRNGEGADAVQRSCVADRQAGAVAIRKSRA